MKILVIDDSGFSRMQMKNILKQVAPDAQILEADGAQKAMDLYDQEMPELVLTDLVMPEIKGDAVVRHVRSKNSDSFVAVVSANVQDRVQEEMKELGADYFLEKPIKLEKVQAVFAAYEQKNNIS
ncbi:MAG: response regulator [SAR324 cluster bacterium]|nr:response regulator [SAR324 cluster bacterium]